jgi:MATE family multidrug resistance protein
MPMILSAMSANVMYVVDRIMLAGYSLDAMNAATASGTLVTLFTFMFIGIASTAEVFVGQYNGCKQYHKLSSPVWQMIYLSILSYLIFFPLAYFSDSINLLPDYYLEYGVPYQKILLYFGFIPGLNAALSAFFIGHGRTAVVTCAVVLCSLVNALLDYVFIYCCKPSLGTQGAALATIIAEGLQMLILLVLFLNKRNRAVYKTFSDRSFDFQLFFGCVKVGIPMSINHFIGFCGWYTIQTVMNHISKDCATVYNIGLNIYVFFIFFGEGLNKAIAAISSNMIGQRDLKSIKKTFKRFVFITLMFCFCFILPLIIFQKDLLSWFNLLNSENLHLHRSIQIIVILSAVSIAFDSIGCVIWGVLVSGGDTKYPAIVNQLCMWGLFFIPTVVLFWCHKLRSPEILYVLMLIVSALSCWLFFMRYKTMKWYNTLV